MNGTDINQESRLNASQSIYVPSDEALEKGKRDAFNLGKLKGILRNIIPSLTVAESDDVFKGFSDLNGLYKERTLHEMKPRDGSHEKKIKRSFPKILRKVQDSVEEFFKFDPPQIISSKHNFNYSTPFVTITTKQKVVSVLTYMLLDKDIRNKLSAFSQLITGFNLKEVLDICLEEII